MINIDWFENKVKILRKSFFKDNDILMFSELCSNPSSQNWHAWSDCVSDVMIYIISLLRDTKMLSFIQLPTNKNLIFISESLNCNPVVFIFLTKNSFAGLMTFPPSHFAPQMLIGLEILSGTSHSCLFVNWSPKKSLIGS